MLGLQSQRIPALELRPSRATLLSYWLLVRVSVGARKLLRALFRLRLNMDCKVRYIGWRSNGRGACRWLLCIILLDLMSRLVR